MGVRHCVALSPAVYFSMIPILTALFHDIEKTSTTTTEERDGRTCIVAPRHAQRGEKTTREILYKQLDVPFHIREEICSLVRYHGVPLWTIEDDNIHQRLINISQRCSMNSSISFLFLNRSLS